jgi:hypothetical protein
MLTVCHLDGTTVGCYSTSGELETIALVTLRYATNVLAAGACQLGASRASSTQPE